MTSSSCCWGVCFASAMRHCYCTNFREFLSIAEPAYAKLQFQFARNLCFHPVLSREVQLLQFRLGRFRQPANGYIHRNTDRRDSRDTAAGSKMVGSYTGGNRQHLLWWWHAESLALFTDSTNY